MPDHSTPRPALRPRKRHLYSVTVAINEPTLAMTARYDYVRASSSLRASQKATDAARTEFGGQAWSTERIEMVA